MVYGLREVEGLGPRVHEACLRLEHGCSLAVPDSAEWHACMRNWGLMEPERGRVGERERDRGAERDGIAGNFDVGYCSRLRRGYADANAGTKRQNRSRETWIESDAHTHTYLSGTTSFSASAVGLSSFLLRASSRASSSCAVSRGQSIMPFASEKIH